MDINTKDILVGTPYKRLLAKYNELKEDLTKTNAYEYYLLYEKMPLSFILKHRRMIYSEPFKGLGFFKELIKNTDIPLIDLKDMVYEIDSYYTDNMKKMNPMQKESLSDLLEIVTSKALSYRISSNLYDHLSVDDDGTSSIIDKSSDLYDMKYNITCGDSDDETNRYKLFNELTNIQHPCILIDAMILLTDIPGGSSVLNDMIDKFTIDEGKTDNIKNWVVMYNIINIILQDKGVYNKISNMKNLELKTKIYQIAQDADINSTIITIQTRRSNENDEVYFATTQDSVNSIFDDNITSELFDDDNTESKRNVTLKSQYAYEVESMFALFDFLMADEEDVDTAIEDATIDFYSTESGLYVNLGDRLNQLMLIAESYKDSYISEFTDGGKQPNIVANSMDKHSEIKKPKQTISSKVTSRALDADKKMKQSVAKSNKVARDAKNAVKAVAKVPDNIANNMKAQVKKWDDMDDDKRKEFIMKPGFRKNYFRLFRLALTHYVAFLINPLMNIVLFMCQNLSAEKNIRIRNELNSELTTEIKICEEKISDASANGDNKKKYQLMRIKDKLEAEQVRIKTNTRYI